MNGKQLFVSYARDDDEPFVKCLVDDLTRNGVAVWWDRQAMDSRGQTFLQVIRDAIVDDCDRLLLVVGPSAVKSHYVEAEWKHALHHCRVVVPIVRGQADVPSALKNAGYNLIPEELKLFHAPDFRDDARHGESVAELLRVLERPARAPGAVHLLPLPSDHWIQDDVRLARLRELLLADVMRPVVIGATKQAAALHGTGGLGKSVLAAMFARDCRTRRAFHDGVVWLAFGRRPEALLEQARRLGSVLGVPALTALPDTSMLDERLDEALDGRALLIVLDDVWTPDQAAPFIRAAAGGRTRLLVTTRDQSVNRTLDATDLELDLLPKAQARSLLAIASGLADDALPAAASGIVDECGGLPLALALMGRMLKGKPADRWDDAFQRLRRAELERLRIEFSDYRAYPHLMAVVEASVEALPLDASNAYLDLALLDDQQRVPQAMLEHLWRHDQADAADSRERIDLLVDRSLLHRDEVGGHFLHDIQHDFVRRRCPDIVAVRRRLIQSYRADCADGWARLPDDGFIRDRLVALLIGADLIDEAHALLWGEGDEPTDWVRSRVAALETVGLKDDLKRALRASASRPERRLRCSLALSSLSSAGTGMSIPLWKAAVRDGLEPPLAALDRVSALPQGDTASLLHKCEVLMALSEADRSLATMAQRAAVKSIETAIADKLPDDHGVAVCLAVAIQSASPQVLEPLWAIGRERGTQAQRNMVAAAAAVRFSGLGNASGAMAALEGIVDGDDVFYRPGYVVGQMARMCTAGAWTAVLRAWHALPTEARLLGVDEVAAAAARHQSVERAWALLEGIGDKARVVEAIERMAEGLAPHEVDEALGRLERTRHTEFAAVTQAQARLIARLPSPAGKEAAATLWQSVFRGYSKGHERAQSALLRNLPAVLWPSEGIESLLPVSDLRDRDREDAFARGLVARGDDVKVLDEIDAALHKTRPWEASSLIAAGAPALASGRLAAWVTRATAITDAHLRDHAMAALLVRQAEVGDAAAAWEGAAAMTSGYAREKAIEGVTVHLRGAALWPALRALRRIGDDPLRTTASDTLLAASPAWPREYALHTVRRAFWPAHLAWRLLGGEQADDMRRTLRGTLSDGDLIHGLLALDMAQGGRDDTTLAEALLALPDLATLGEVLQQLTTRLTARREDGWSAGAWAAQRARLAPGAEAIFDRFWSVRHPRALTRAAVLLSWCRGPEAALSRMVDRAADESYFDGEFAVRLGALHFSSDPAHDAKPLIDAVVESADPYAPLINSGDLRLVPATVYPSLKRTLLERWGMSRDGLRSEASALAVAGARLQDTAFALDMARDLADRPASALEVLLAVFDASPSADIAREAARVAFADRALSNQPWRRSDQFACVVLRLLRLPLDDVRAVLDEFVDSMAGLPRSEWFMLVAALAPLLVMVLGDDAAWVLNRDFELAALWWP